MECSPEIKNMCKLGGCPHHGPSPIPEEGN